MELKELIIKRHSVRNYKKENIEENKIAIINSYIDELNKNDLYFKLITNEDIFKNWFLGYGFIKNCNNYILLAGKDDETLEERVGYFGELLVLKLLDLGINSCFVGGTYKKKMVDEKLPDNYKKVMVLAIGYGISNGSFSKTKKFEEVSISKDVPTWFKNGIDLVLLAPSAVNQKKWKFVYEKPNFVKIIPGGKLFQNVDKGIAKLHFEIGAGKDNFIWKE